MFRKKTFIKTTDRVIGVGRGVCWASCFESIKCYYLVDVRVNLLSAYTVHPCHTRQRRRLRPARTRIAVVTCVWRKTVAATMNSCRTYLAVAGLSYAYGSGRFADTAFRISSVRSDVGPDGPGVGPKSRSGRRSCETHASQSFPSQRAENGRCPRNKSVSFSPCNRSCRCTRRRRRKTFLCAGGEAGEKRDFHPNW